MNTRDAHHSPKRGGGGMAVAPSPLNPVKLDLALLLVGAGLLWGLLEAAGVSDAHQLLSLGGAGLAGAVWLVWRTRRVLAARRPAGPA